MIFSFKRGQSPNAEMLSRAFEDILSPKTRLLLLSLLIAPFFLVTGCGIYNGGFERGGDLTSNFLKRIQENSKEQEDFLLPKEELKACSTPFQK